MDIGTLTGVVAIEDQVSGRLKTIASELTSLATSAGGTFGAIANTAVFAAGAVAGVGTAIVGVAVSIDQLAQHGADLNDIATSFERIAGGAKTADTIIQEMEEGVLGTIGKYDLMRTANRLLTADVKLTAEQFGTLSEAAFMLQNRGLGPTTEMLNSLSRAMLTGRMRQVEFLIGKIDLRKAEKEYAEYLGVTVDKLSLLGKTEAARRGLLAELERQVQQSGKQERDYGENVAYAWTQLKNWKDELSRTVAAMPEVNRALRDIGQAILDAFGGSKEIATQKILSWIESFAKAVSHYGPIIIREIAAIGAEIQNLYNTVMSEWNALPEPIRNFLKAGVMAAARPGVRSWVDVAKAMGAGPEMTQALEDQRKALEDLMGTRARYQHLPTLGPPSLEDLGPVLGPPPPAIDPRHIKSGEDAAAAAKSASDSLRESFFKTERETVLFAKEFEKLTFAQRANVDVQRELVPRILAYAAAHKTLTPEMRGVVEQYALTRQAIEASDRTKLESINLTIEEIESLQAQGRTMGEIAAQYGVLDTSMVKYAELLDLIRDKNKEFAEASKTTWDDVAKGLKEAVGMTEEAANAIIAAQDEQYTITEALNARQRQDTMTTLQYNLDALVRQGEARKKHWKLLLGETAQYKELAQAIDDLTTDSMSRELAATEEINAALASLSLMFPQLTVFLHAYAEATGKAAEESQTLTDVFADMFTQLGQITGGRLGDLVTMMGQITIGFQTAQKAADSLDTKGGQLNQGFGNLGVVLNSNAKALDRWQAGGVMVSGVISGIQGMRSALDHASKGARTWNAAMSGAQIGGAIVPGWGHVIGAAAGALVGAFSGKPAWADVMDRVAHDYGVKISEELGRGIADQAKEQFGGSRQAAEIFNLDKIIEEAGGLTSANVEQLMARFRDTFVMVGEGMFTAAEGVEVLDKNFLAFLEHSTDETGHWSAAIKEIIDLARVNAMESEAIKAAQVQQAQIIVGSFNAIVAGAQKARDVYAALAKTVADAKLSGDADALTEALTAQHRAAEGAKQELEDLGTIAKGAFGVALATGASFLEALLANRSGLAALRKSYQDLGMNVEDPFLKMLFVQEQVVDTAPELIDSVNALANSLVAMDNLNILTGESFESMGRTAYTAYVRLQDQVARAGGTTRDALLPMQAYLQEAARQAEALGLPLDENLQMMIAQSKELVIWKDKGPTAAERMEQATAKLTQTIERLINTMLGIPDELPDPFRNWKPPAGPGGEGGTPTYNPGPNTGFPGGAGLRVGQQANTPAGVGGQNVAQKHVHVNVDGRQLVEVVIDRLGNVLALKGGR